jgi:hypothetical protein
MGRGILVTGRIWWVKQVKGAGVPAPRSKCTLHAKGTGAARRAPALHRASFYRVRVSRYREELIPLA